MNQIIHLIKAFVLARRAGPDPASRLFFAAVSQGRLTPDQVQGDVGVIA
jgi:hypothetical protein